MIEVTDLRKTYAGGTEAVRGVSFEVKEGEFFGFLGPNGAGKTTTINMLVSLVKKTSGKVVINGLDLDRSAHEIFKHVGFAMQEVGLDETATAREMLELHGRLYHLPKTRIKEQIDKLLSLVELEKVADRYTSTYSGGMRRRFDLALALIHEPKVLFLDEPTQGLSVEETAQAVETLAGFLERARITVLLVEHDMEVVFQLAHEITVLHRGGVIADGTPAAVKADARVQEAYLGALAA